MQRLLVMSILGAISWSSVSAEPCDRNVPLEFSVTEIRSARLPLYAEPDGKKVDSIKKNKLLQVMGSTGELQIFCEAGNGRLLVEIAGKKMWINASQVVTNKPVEFDSALCEEVIDVSATRMMGGCE